MTHWRPIAEALAAELRRLPCRKVADYNGVMVGRCERCEALKAFDEAVKGEKANGK